MKALRYFGLSVASALRRRSDGEERETWTLGPFEVPRGATVTIEKAGVGSAFYRPTAGNGLRHENGGAVAEEYDPREQDEAFEVLTAELRRVLRDGGKKRAAGTKPPWWRDGSHITALYSHLYKWAGKGERVDSDSGAHPLVHLACRALMLAYQETNGLVEPRK